MSKHTPRKAFAPVANADARDPQNPADTPAQPPQAQSPRAQPPVATEEERWEPQPLPYDPADYRWVPVRRIPREDGWTAEKQRCFIETLADTGLVNVAARTVGMSRESAYRLRRSAHGAAFARAWDAARHHAGGLIEDIAFERAIEGTEQEMLNSHGEVIATRLVHDNRLLKYLLSHLKPDRYGGGHAPGPAPAPAPAPGAIHTRDGEATPPASDMPALEKSLRAMEPIPPAPPEQMLDAGTFADELETAEIADGVLPHFLSGLPMPKSDAERAREKAAARHARGEAASEKREAGGTLTPDEFADECYYLDPSNNKHPPCRRRQGTSTV